LLFALWRSGARPRHQAPPIFDREGEAGQAASKAACSYAIRILIPHHTTASAITTQVAVKAFSKADEAIAMLSFAYPDEVSM
jgi:hypothetical protein